MSKAKKAPLNIVRHGNQRWAVILNGKEPVVVYAGLGTQEAAEAARHEAAGQMAENGSMYGPSEVPSETFEQVGRVMQTLRDQGLGEHATVELACKVYLAARPLYSPDLDMEIPF